MSAHRQHYFEANWAPEEPTPSGFDSRIVVALSIALLAIVSTGAALTWSARQLRDQEPVVTPVHAPEIVHYPLPPLDVAEARIEGFRAGYAEALAQGCKATLSAPVRTR